MQLLIDEYKEQKCNKCNNRFLSSNKDKCDIRTYYYGGYIYCKCCNMTDEKKEIKKKYK